MTNSPRSDAADSDADQTADTPAKQADVNATVTNPADVDPDDGTDTNGKPVDNPAG